MRLCVRTEGPLRLEYLLDSGQVFRWSPTPDGRWYGVLGDVALCLFQDEDGLVVEADTGQVDEARIRAFLGLDDPMPLIAARLCRSDPVLARAFAACAGFRVVCQDPWEALVSFICSSRNTVFRIQQMTSALARCFGERREVDGRALYTFPSAQRLAALQVEELTPCRLGYRDRFVLDAARRVASGSPDLMGLRSVGYEQAREALLSVPGVGMKVADCVLLMGLGKKDRAFPVDVWVRRAVVRHYRKAVVEATGVALPTDDRSLTERQHRAVVTWAEHAFEPCVGHAQAALFLASRSGAI